MRVANAIRAFPVVLALLLACSAATADDRARSRLHIDEVHSEYGLAGEVTLLIEGENLLPRRNQQPYISLGYGRDFELIESTGERVVLRAWLNPGEYLLRISHHRYFKSQWTSQWSPNIGRKKLRSETA